MKCTQMYTNWYKLKDWLANCPCLWNQEGCCRSASRTGSNPTLSRPDRHPPVPAAQPSGPARSASGPAQSASAPASPHGGPRHCFLFCLACLVPGPARPPLGQAGLSKKDPGCCQIGCWIRSCCAWPANGASWTQNSFQILTLDGVVYNDVGGARPGYCSQLQRL